jgi:formate dehydrogenase major subunit
MSGKGRTSTARRRTGRPGRTRRRRRWQRDETLQHPRCVFQVLKRHYARYTPEMVERMCGVSQADFLAVCEAGDS